MTLKRPRTSAWVVSFAWLSLYNLNHVNYITLLFSPARSHKFGRQGLGRDDEDYDDEYGAGYGGYSGYGASQGGGGADDDEDGESQL